MTAAFQLDMRPAEKLLLLALADNAYDEGICYPSEVNQWLLALYPAKPDRRSRAGAKSMPRHRSLPPLPLSRSYPSTTLSPDMP
jgi:hypothetical protein